MREKIFRWIMRGHPEGALLTKFQLFAMAVLFPIRWLIQGAYPYDPVRDVWDIHGKKYTGQALYDLANSQGEVFKVSQSNGCTTLERIST